MANQLDQKKQALLEELKTYIGQQHPKQVAQLLSDFVDYYYRLLSYEDLASKGVEQLHASLWSHWQFFYQRKPGESRVRVFNPDQEQDGWQSTHTIVQIIHDDMSFLVDSVRMEINRHGYLVHYIVHLGGIRVKRDDKNRITHVYPRDKAVKDTIAEAPIYLEIDRQIDPEVMKKLEDDLERVLSDVTLAVNDWHNMLDQLDDSLARLEAAPPNLDPAEITESKAFLNWMREHFIFLGCRDHAIEKDNGDKVIKSVPDSGYGVLCEECHDHRRYLSQMTEEAQQVAMSQQILVIAKTNTKSTIHRPGYTDYVGVKMFNEDGEIVGERRFIGLYTSSAYNASPRYIPFLRLKVAKVLQKANFSPHSHAGKNLLNILETLPRDDLFQANQDELLDLALGIFHLQERQRIRLFVRKDTYGRFYSCLVFVPRENFNTELTRRMRSILCEEFNAEEVTYSIHFSESILARIHFMVRVDSKRGRSPDVQHVEDRLRQVGMSWRQELKESLIERYGEATGIMYFNRFRHTFPASYQEAYLPEEAINDIEQLDALTDDKPLVIDFYESRYQQDEQQKSYQFKVYQKSEPIPLSDALPILENLGFKVMGEQPHRIYYDQEELVWINDFDLVLTQDWSLQVDKAKACIKRAFAAIWLGQAENDALNQLVVAAELDWREVLVLRAYARYFQQTTFPFSQSYIAKTLMSNLAITKRLVKLFNYKFRLQPANDKQREGLIGKLQQDFDSVTSLDEDRILRSYMNAILATVRTNYYQQDDQGEFKPYFSFKLLPKSMPDLPLPLPEYEIFVYSPRVEGVHLRGGKVARGGLRWSDRREDFRTEVLGLMKAQQVKNAVIVPMGAKGGFVAKQLPLHAGREAMQKEGIECYKLFIKGLLDITDNVKQDTVYPPKQVVRYDDDDPYLVVAADKGTATFSDIANDLAQQYGFWMDDAFASGGSTGYDHKDMGITAKGAWESVKRHFREMGRDIQQEPFTAVGIGDMSGDVFGNGMLLSRCTRLVAAFNHRRIFIDPNPDPETSYKERLRLFDQKRSSWDDYDTSLISQGGGVFKRSDKSIPISPEMKKCFGISEDNLTPNRLIQYILKAPVDLLWNGGIGTYIKSSEESQASVGDRANDSVRVDGCNLRCQVLGEGGNLGATQLGRIQFALNGGRCYADFIDNSGGVDCSDHEVNIKILLNQVQEKYQLDDQSRNQLLASMTDEVNDLVVYNNYAQSLAVSISADASKANMDLLSRYITGLEQQGKLNRELEFLPDVETFLERKANNTGLTRPEMAVLLAYGKIRLKEQILDSDIVDQSFFREIVFWEFPKQLREQYEEVIDNHSLRREIIATQMSNHLINQMGITFIERVEEETNAPVEEVVKAYFTAEAIFNKSEIWHQIEDLDHVTTNKTQFAMIKKLNRLLRRATRWLLRHYPGGIKHVEEVVTTFQEPLAHMKQRLPSLLVGENKERVNELAQQYMEANVPKQLAHLVAMSPSILSVLDIVAAANASGWSLEQMARAYFYVGDKLSISWVRNKLIHYRVSDRWNALARSALRNDVDYIQRQLTVKIISYESDDLSIEDKFKAWTSHHEKLYNMWCKRLSEIRSVTELDLIMFSVMTRDLFDLIQLSERE